MLADKWPCARAADRPRPEGRRVPRAEDPGDFNWNFNRTIREQIHDLAAGGFVRRHKDLFCRAARRGKKSSFQAIGRQLVHAGFTVLYRSIFDVVRDFLHDEAFEGHDRAMARYLNPIC